MALNFQRDALDGSSAQRNNQTAIERHLNDDHYVRGFTPGMFVLSAKAVPTYALDGVTSDWPIIIMLHGDTSYASTSWRKPSEWRSGLMRVRYWYTADVGSANTFRIQLSVRAIRDSEVVAGTSLLSAASSVAGPAVAQTLTRSAYTYTTTALGSDDELFSLRVARLGADAADTNVNEFHLLYAEIEHIPAQQVSQ